MAKKTIYKTVIMMEVLSDEPIPDNMTNSEIEYECTEGSYSGLNSVVIANKPIKGVAAVKEILKHGSSIDFFMMDEKGNEIDF